MPAFVLMVPGPLDSLTGGYEFDRRIVAGLRESGWSVQVCELDESFPYPTAGALRAADAVLAATPAGTTVLIDGLALGAMPEVVAPHAGRLAIVALVHHPLAAETGLAPDVARDFEISERRALASARRVVVTSAATARDLAQYDVAPSRIDVVEPGTDSARPASGSHNGPRQLLCVATLIPRKGHTVLFHALAALPTREYRLTCVGSLRRHPPTVQQLREQLRGAGLDDVVSLVGEVDRAALDGYYDGADLCILPTLHEGYGMAVAEALAHGLPVVSTTVAAIAAQVPSQAGLLVPPGDVTALTSALVRWMGDPDLRVALRQGAHAIRDRLPTWDAAVARMARVLQTVSDDVRIQR